jgi:uncharacterized membrane protein YqjE
MFENLKKIIKNILVLIISLSVFVFIYFDATERYNKLELFILWSLICLLFTQGWYLNTRLELIHKKLDKILSNIRNKDF